MLLVFFQAETEKGLLMNKNETLFSRTLLCPPRGLIFVCFIDVPLKRADIYLHDLF